MLLLCEMCERASFSCEFPSPLITAGMIVRSVCVEMPRRGLVARAGAKSMAAICYAPHGESLMCRLDPIIFAS